MPRAFPADADKSGFLDKAETKALVKELVATTKEVAIEQIDTQIAEMKSQGMPPFVIEMQAGIVKALKEWQPNEDEMTTAMWAELDENGDGKVSSQEFLDHWEKAAMPIGQDIAMALMGPALQGMAGALGGAEQECKQQ